MGITTGGHARQGNPYQVSPHQGALHTALHTGILWTSVVALALAACIGSACSTSGESAQQQEPASNPTIAQTDDEIGTYDRIDTGKTQLVIGIVGSEDLTTYLEGFSALHPDVQPIVVYLQKGSAAYSPANAWIVHGYAPDIVFGLALGQEASTYQVDLTSSDAATRYDSSSLEPLSSGGKIYSLPGPSKVMAIEYNKTMFEEYGWQVPTTFDEFIALCDRITADTAGSVRPYSPNAKYVEDYMAGLEGFAYGKVFSGASNAAWYQGVVSGEGGYAKHMQPFFDMVQTMVDHGLIDDGDFSYSYTERSKEFKAGHIAMMNIIVDPSAAFDDFDCGYMPFPALDGASSYLVTRSNYTVCETVRERTDAQSQAAADFLDYISTSEAQDAYISSTLAISHVKGTGVPSSANSTGLSSLIENGLLFERLSFAEEAVPASFSMLDAMRSQTQLIAKGSATAAQAATACEEALSEAIANPGSTGQTEGTAIATAAEDFTVLQTSEYIADAFKAATGADIALIPDNSIYRGNIHRLFAGSITKASVEAMLPRSFDNASTLVKAEMTGSQIMDALCDPPDYNDETSDCVYAFSGLKATVAPTNDIGEKYLSVTLEDGTELDPGATYTVAFWAGMVRDKYITGSPQPYDTSYAELLIAAMTEDGTLVPPDDGRMTLVWE